MSTNRKPTLSLIIPVYNEHKRLTVGIARVLGYLTKKTYRWELIIVDDGSDVPVSAALTRARKLGILAYDLTRLPVVIIRLPKNLGKGAAIAAGVVRARGTYIAFCDVDMSVPIAMVDKLIRALHRNPIVITSRRLTESVVAAHQPWVRENMGRVFTMLSNVLCQTDVADATCGMKGYQAPYAKKLYKLRRVNRWVFDTEVLFLARKLSIPIHEIPVTWHHKSGSKVRSIDVVGSCVDLFRIRWNDVIGAYS